MRVKRVFRYAPNANHIEELFFYDVLFCSIIKRKLIHLAICL